MRSCPRPKVSTIDLKRLRESAWKRIDHVRRVSIRYLASDNLRYVNLFLGPNEICKVLKMVKLGRIRKLGIIIMN